MSSQLLALATSLSSIILRQQLQLGSYGLAEPFICDQSAVFIVLVWVWS